MEPFKILIVEDDEGVLRLVQKKLLRSGFHIDIVLNGTEAIASITDKPPELMILDHKLPDMTGDQVIKNLKKRNSEVPFIVITGHGDEKVAVEMMKLGALDYLVKSPGFLDLLSPVVERVAGQLETDKINAETKKKLRESEARYEGLFGNMISGVAVYEAVDKGENFVFKDLNRAGEEMEHIKKEDIIGKRVTEAFPGVKEFGVFEILQRVWGTGKPEYLPAAVYKDERDHSTWRENWVYKLANDEVVTIYNNVTERKLLEGQLIRSERLAASGQLAASVAHEINSPLQGITSILNSIERAYKQDERLLEKLNFVKSGFTNIRDIVKKLLDLNRPGKERKQSVNINSVIEDTAGLLKSYLKKNKVKISLNLSSKLPSITVSPQQLGQVFMNLISNAVEALIGTSKSKVGLKTRESTDREITINSTLRKDNITIRVADTGPGISKQDMVHVFDPFYTRKKIMGMGVGLSICNGIIENHNGSIVAKNSPEGGAIFTITLPIR
jgi:signal transduction histidine kinase/FixJ family two-component response regulator